MARKIVITSGKGGVGKTSVTAGIGIAIASRGYKTLMIDADVGLNNLDVVMGLEDKIVFDLSDYLLERCSIEDAIIQDTYCKTLFILPSSHSISSSDVTSSMFRNIVLELDSMFDVILIDCPAGIEQGFFRAISLADEAIVVTTPHVSAIRDADKVISILLSYNFSNVNIVVNRVRSDLLLKGEMIDATQISKILKRPLLGVLPEDDVITTYSQLGRIDLAVSPIKQSINMILGIMFDGIIQIYDPTKKYNSFINNLKRFFVGNKI